MTRKTKLSQLRKGDRLCKNHILKCIQSKEESFVYYRKFENDYKIQKHLPKFENILQKLEKRTCKNQNEMVHLKPKIVRMCSCQARLPDCRRSSLLPLGAHLLQFVVCCSSHLFFIFPHIHNTSSSK